MKILSYTWWNERVIDVPEHYFDWMAPRWYLVIVVMAYAAMAWMIWDMV